MYGAEEERKRIILFFVLFKMYVCILNRSCAGCKRRTCLAKTVEAVSFGRRRGQMFVRQIVAKISRQLDDQISRRPANYPAY